MFVIVMMIFIGGDRAATLRSADTFPSLQACVTALKVGALDREALARIIATRSDAHVQVVSACLGLSNGVPA